MEQLSLFNLARERVAEREDTYHDIFGDRELLTDDERHEYDADEDSEWHTCRDERYV